MRKAAAFLAALVLTVLAGTASADSYTPENNPRDGAPLTIRYEVPASFEVVIPADLMVDSGNTGSVEVQINSAARLYNQFINISLNGGLHASPEGERRLASVAGGSPSYVPYTVTLSNGEAVGPNARVLRAANGTASPVSETLTFTMGDAPVAGMFEDTLTFRISFSAQ